MKEQRFDSDKTWGTLIKASLPISLALVGSLINHEVRLGEIESTEFRAVDGHRLEADLKKYFRDNYPPGWLLDQISELKKSVKSLESRSENCQKR